MSRTKLHKELAKCRSGVMDWSDASRKTKNYCDRQNYEVGERRKNKKLLIEKIIDNEKILE
jgi:hypothetical protein